MLTRLIITRIWVHKRFIFVKRYFWETKKGLGKFLAEFNGETENWPELNDVRVSPGQGKRPTLFRRWPSHNFLGILCPGNKTHRDKKGFATFEGQNPQAFGPRGNFPQYSRHEILTLNPEGFGDITSMFAKRGNHLLWVWYPL